MLLFATVRSQFQVDTVRKDAESVIGFGDAPKAPTLRSRRRSKRRSTKKKSRRSRSIKVPKTPKVSLRRGIKTPKIPTVKTPSLRRGKIG